MIYFARKGDLIKIGFSANPQKRLREIGARPIRIMDGGFEIERALHDRFRASHVGGEWFRPSRRLVTLDLRQSPQTSETGCSTHVSSAGTEPSRQAK